MEEQIEFDISGAEILAVRLLKFALTEKAKGNDVFTEWFPHVQWVTIRAHKGLWTSESTSYSRDFPIEDTQADIVKKLKEISDFLTSK